MTDTNSAEQHTSSIEDIDDVTRKATVSIPVTRVSKEFDSAIRRVQQSAKIKGFRPGKAPLHLVQKLHGPRIQMEVANQLISASLEAVIQGMKETVVGNPEIELSSFEPGKEITYTASLSIFPQPEINGYESFEVSVVKREVSDEGMQKVIDNLLNSKSTQKPVEGRTQAQAGDVIDALLEVIVDGAVTQSEPLVIAIGENILPPELETGIVGMQIGEAKDIEVARGEDGADKQIFRITLNGLNQKILPELTDELVKELAMEGIETVLELKMDIRKRLEEEQSQASEDDVNSEIMKVLIEKNEFKIPSLLIDEEIRSLIARSGVVDPKKVDLESVDIEPYRKMFTEAAERRVRMTIIVDQIAEKESLKAKDEDLEAHIITIADKHNLPTEEVKKYFLDKSRAMGTFLEVTRNKVLKFLNERAKVSFLDEQPKA